MLVNKDKGMVLLMVLAVLTLLCLLGLMFVMMANMERATARAYLDMVRTKMVAQSGIHAAMVNTRALLTEKGFDIEEMVYHGEDLNADGGITVGLEAYEDQDTDDTLQILECPIYRAVHPSYMVDLDHDGDLDQDDLINVQGKWVGVSGIMPGPYNQDLGAYYVTKVEDLSGKIFINGVEDGDEKKMLERVLGNLTEELFGSSAIGMVMVREAPHVNLAELRDKLIENNITLTEQELTRLKSCITINAWRDTSVIKPVELQKRLGDTLGVPLWPGEDIFTWRSVRPLRIQYPTNELYGGGTRLVGRAPVNVNTAPEEVLIALIRGLGGLWFDEVAYFQPAAHYDILKIYYKESEYDSNKRGSLGRLGYTEGISRDQAYQIAQAIIKNRESELHPNQPWRGTFRSWQQFGHFCDKVLVEGLDHNITPGLLTPQQADVLKANFNPNSNLPEFNPPSQRLFWVGKDNLWLYESGMGGASRIERAYSMEFSFFPTGYFSITSLGRLLGKDNQVLSEAEIQTTVQLFSLYRETSQKEFLEDFWKNNESIYSIISENTNSSIQNTHCDNNTNKDLTLQVYPEILEYDSYNPDKCRGYQAPVSPWNADTAPGSGDPYVQGAHYDGYITLATVENRCDQSNAPDFRASYSKYGLNANIPQNLTCLVDPEDPNLSYTRGPYHNRLVCRSHPSLSSVERNTFKRTPGTLFPDGVYSERDSVPMYDYRPTNMDDMAVSMWIKPHFFPDRASKLRTFLTYQVMGSVSPPLAQESIFEHLQPFGIYSIVNNLEFGWAWDLTKGYDYCGFVNTGSGYDNASFITCAPGTHGFNYMWGGGIITPCLNHLGVLPGSETAHSHPEAGGEKYITAFGRDYPTVFKAGKWLHLAWSHHAETSNGLGRDGNDVERPAPSANLQYDVLWVNGIRCDGLLSDIVFHNNSNSAYLDKYYSADNLLRLGERTFNDAASQVYNWLNSAADSTIDEVCIWDDLGADPDIAAEVLIDEIWRQGRYYRYNDGAFTSRSINLAKESNLPTDTPVTVFMVAWTQYVPEQIWGQQGYQQGLWWRFPGSSYPPPTCDIEIWDKDRTSRIGVRKDVNSIPEPSGELIKDAYSSKELVVFDSIRYRVLFKPNVPNNRILIDPLIFDDITIIYYSVPKFLSWAYRR